MTNKKQKNEMLASELIRELQERMAQHGDMIIHIGYNGERAAAVATADLVGVDLPYLAIMDATTADLFAQMQHVDGEVNA